MKTIKKIFFFVLITMMSVSMYAQTWVNDPMHSRIGFTVSRNTMLDVSGVFKKFDIKINAAKTDLSDAVITVNIETASIDTEIEMRDKHLKNADFLDVEKYPKMTFVSTNVSKINTNTLQVIGNLTLHGVTKPVTLTLKVLGQTHDERSKKDQIGIKVTGYFNRTDFNVGSKASVPMIGDQVDLVADILMQK